MPVSWPSSSKMLRTSQLVVVFPALPVTPTTASFLDGLQAQIWLWICSSSKSVSYHQDVLALPVTPTSAIFLDGCVWVMVARADRPRWKHAASNIRQPSRHH